VEVILEVFAETWNIVLEAAPYVLGGFLAAGLLYVFIDANWISRNLGRGRYKPVFLAALFGIPLPLCSCGVVPTAMGLRKQGANDGATVSFLISTPETGVDSMAVTWALLGPAMTVIRPVAAFLTAVVAGVAQNLLGRGAGVPPNVSPDSAVCRVDACCDGQGCSPAEHAAHHTTLEKLWAGTRYAFGALLDDMAGWLGLGFLLAGLIGVLIPDEFISRYLGSGWLPMVVMLVTGVPMYMCATASTPIAAALMLKGLSPGAALVFLLAGPATNVASLTVLAGTLGRRSVFLYLSSIVVCSLVAGFAVDGLYGSFAQGTGTPDALTGSLIPAWVEWGSGILLALLIAKGILVRSRFWRRRSRPEGKACSDEHCDCSHEAEHPPVLKVSSVQALLGKPREEPPHRPEGKP